MDILGKSKKVAELLKQLEADKEHIGRIKELNKYDHEKETSMSYDSRFHIKFCGGNTHTHLCIHKNDLGDKIEAFFTEILQERIDLLEFQLKDLLQDEDE